MFTHRELKGESITVTVTVIVIDIGYRVGITVV